MISGFTILGLILILRFAKAYIESTQAQRKLEQQRLGDAQRAQKYLDIAGTIIVALDTEAKVTLINRAGCESLGYSENQIIGKDWIETVIPEFDKDKVRAVFDGLMRGNEITYEHVRYHGVLTRSGEQRLISWHNTVVTDEQGKVMGTLSSGEDVTEHVRVENELRHSEARLRQVIDLVPHMILAKDRNGIILLANQAQAEAYSTTVEALVGRSHRDLHHDSKEVSRMLLDDQEVINTGETKFIPEEEFTDHNGKLRKMQTTKIPFTESGSNEPAILGIAIDITEFKRVEQALQEAKELAEHANLQKSRFLAAASHDLRQPLQTLTLLNGVLARKVCDKKLKEIVENQAKSLHLMGDLLNALLNISKLDAGVVFPEITDFPVEGLLDRMRIEFNEQAQAKGLDLRVVHSSATIRTDPVLLERIVENLVSNALKHTDYGKVLIGCRHRGKTLRIEVWDTGKGIPENQQRTIFAEFYQLENPAREMSKGLGLGLAIVDRLARLLNHPLELRSALGKGTMFAVKVPIGKRISKNYQEKPVSSSALAQLKVLLIEDDPFVLQASRWLFEAYGAQVYPVESGYEALEQLKSKIPRPDLVITDYRLPGNKSGLEVIQHMQKVLGYRLPVVIVTGDTSLKVLDEVEASGFKLVSKPINIDKLITLIQRLLRAEPQLGEH